MEVRIKPLGMLLLLVVIVLGGVGLWNVRQQMNPAPIPIPTPRAIATKPVGRSGEDTPMDATSDISAIEIPAFSKTASFGSIKANDPAIKKAISAQDLKKAADFVDSRATFAGTITKIFTPAGGKVRILNFADDYKTAISGLVDAQDFGKFPDPEALVGKQVVVSGAVIEFQGRPEVQFTDPAQIKIITK